MNIPSLPTALFLRFVGFPVSGCFCVMFLRVSKFMSFGENMYMLGMYLLRSGNAQFSRSLVTVFLSGCVSSHSCQQGAKFKLLDSLALDCSMGVQAGSHAQSVRRAHRHRHGIASRQRSDLYLGDSEKLGLCVTGGRLGQGLAAASSTGYRVWTCPPNRRKRWERASMPTGHLIQAISPSEDFVAFQLERLCELKMISILGSLLLHFAAPFHPEGVCWWSLV